jgi:hypothetical protein
MRLKLFLLVYIAMHLSLISRAQSFETKIADLYIPDVPGFVLSDKAPTSVDKPVTPRAFGISLLNLWQGGAVNVTPFWLSSKPAYTFSEWVSKKFTAVETFNLSGATFKTDTTSVLSIGFRSQVLRIYSKNRRKELLDKEEEIRDIITPKLDSADNPIDMTEEEVNKALAKLEELEQLKSKDLFSVEIAGAILGSSKTNSYKNLASERSGVWMNLRWTPARSMLDFTGVARYSWANNVTPKASKDSSFLDFGLALNYEKKNFNFSLEYVTRKDFSIKKSYDRFAFVANYILTENVVLVASIGKNFDKIDNIITAFGVKFGLSRSKVAIEPK